MAPANDEVRFAVYVAVEDAMKTNTKSGAPFDVELQPANELVWLVVFPWITKGNALDDE